MLRRFLLPMLAMFLGCQACPVDVSQQIQVQAATAAAVRPCVAAESAAPAVLDLPTLWSLALANNPALREAAAELEAARGQLIQAGKYPNPRFVYSHEELGAREAPAGAVVVELNQDIVTAGKRRLDMAIAARATDMASVALVGRKFDVLTRIRRAYYEYQGWRYTVGVSERVVAALEQGVAITRKQVEEAKTRPRADLVRLQAVLEEAKIGLVRSRINLEAGWRQLAAEVGVPHLPMPAGAGELAFTVPTWDVNDVVLRVLAANTELKQAAAEAERARLEIERARADVVPNVTLGGGYTNNFVEKAQGAVINVETALPLWDRKQGRIHQAQARWAQAQAAQRTVPARLAREAAEAFGRYQAAGEQVERLTKDVLPRLEESLDLVRRSYQAGAAQITFADVLLAEQTLNETRLRIAEARRDLWRAIADLQGLMQLDLGEELGEHARVGD